MSRRTTLSLLLVTASLMSACLPAQAPEPNSTLAPAIATVTNATFTPEPTETLQPPSKLTLWIPPFFAPTEEGAAGALFMDRLRDFETRHPGLNVELRVKAEQGGGGLLDSLLSANAAAPSALPDVILLEPDALRSASVHGILADLDTWLMAPDDSAWYEFALPVAHHDGHLIAYPAGSFVDVLAYRTELFSDPPRSWELLLQATHTFLFPAGDTRARFTMADYLATGAGLRDQNGNLSLDAAALSEVLNFYSQASELGVVQDAARQYTRTSETWRELLANRSASAMAPLTSFMNEADPDRHAAIPQPTQDGRGVAFATTWSWSAIQKNPLQAQLAAELIAWLSEPDFAGPWTYALGILPTTSAALAVWPDGPKAALASSLVTVALPLPEESVRTRMGPLMENAVEAVLEKATAPTRAAQTAVEALQSP